MTRPPVSRLDGRWLIAAALLVCVLGAWLLGSTRSVRNDARLVPPIGSSSGPLAPVTASVAASVGTEMVVPAGKEQAIRKWLEADDGAPVELPGGLVHGGISIEQKTVEYSIVRDVEGEWEQVGSVTVHHTTAAPPDAQRGKTLAAVGWLADPDDAAAADAVSRLANHVVTQDAAEVFEAREVRGLFQPPADSDSDAGPTPMRAHVDSSGRVDAIDDPHRRAMHHGLARQLYWTCLLMAVLAGVSLSITVVRGRRVAVPVVAKLTHLLPAVLQLAIFTYWSLHWPPARHLALLILPQFVVAYVVEICLSSVARGSWAASFGNFPVVLSTNLLAQFVGGAAWVSLCSVALAVALKVFVRRDSGKPVFNPSALGLTIMGFVQIFGPEVAGGDFTHEFSSPPNMAELIFLLALIVQFRLKLTLITLSAALAMGLGNLLPPFPGFLVAWPPFLLVICLLITDPSTIPKTPGGRIVYSVTIVVCMLGLQTVFFALGMSDFWAKVMAIPLANLMAPKFDQWGAAFGRFTWLGPQYNSVHVIIWAVVFLASVSRKGSNVVDDPPLSPCWRDVADGWDGCAANPAFCTPFSLRRELECWLGPSELELDERPQHSVLGE